MSKQVDQAAIKEEVETLARVEEILTARREGKESSKLRRERNHALVQAGLALKAMIESGLVSSDLIDESLPKNKAELVKKWIFPQSNQP